MKIYVKKILFFSTLIFLAVLTFVRKPSPPYQSAGTRRMAERLAQIAQNVDPKTNLFASAARIKYLRGLAPPDQANKLMVMYHLGLELLNNGQTAEAIEQFKQVLQSRYLIPPDVVLQIRGYLALAYLRLGEQDNCVNQHSIESCLLPIEGKGVHTIQRGSRAAINEYSALLNEQPNNLSHRWLLNIAYMTLGEYPNQVPEQWLIPPAAFDSDYDVKRFYDVAPGLGLDVVGLAGGSIMEDFDGDGYLDIMASSWGLFDQLRYFRNNGDGTFTERTAEAGLIGVTGGLNICHADYNNDGYPDVIVMRGAWLYENGAHPNSLLRNNGNGAFDDVTEEAGLLSFHPTPSAAWGDYDNDGWVDLFVANESFKSLNNPCQLYHNNGDGTFTEIAAQVGAAAGGFAKGAVWGDYNNDGLLDLYISRLYEPNILYRNEGKDASGRWSFKDVSVAAGVTEPLHSFPTWFFDYDNDGWLDIFVSGYFAPHGSVAADYLGLPTDAERPRLYRNNRDGTFADVTRASHLYKVLFTMGCNFGDLDNDGFLDFYLGTGDPDFRSLMPNRMFRNAEGKFFQDVTTAGGFGHLQKGHGVAFGDLDNDGDQDIYLVVGGALPGDAFQNALFENPGHGNHWITLKLEGIQTNRAAIGARIKIAVDTEKGSRDIFATVTTGGSFGASSLQQEIGLGQATSIRAIEIIWPTTGTIQIFEHIAMDQMLKIREGDPVPVPIKLKRFDLSPDDVRMKHAESSNDHH